MCIDKQDAGRAHIERRRTRIGSQLHGRGISAEEEILRSSVQTGRTILTAGPWSTSMAGFTWAARLADGARLACRTRTASKALFARIA